MTLGALRLLALAALEDLGVTRVAALRGLGPHADVKQWAVSSLLPLEINPDVDNTKPHKPLSRLSVTLHRP